MSDKKTYTVLSPIGFSGRREIGEAVEMTDEEAAAFGPEYVVPGSAAPQENTDSEGGSKKGARKKLESYPEKELKEIAKKRGVKVPGRGKSKIIAALRETK